VILFGVSKTAFEINHGLFGLWASWLLFSILVTLLFGVLLVNSCTSGVNAKAQSRKQLRPPKRSWLIERIRSWDKNGDKRRFIFFVTAFVICLLLVIFSEKQVQQNCVFDENTQWGFGQLTAMLFALAPLWSILESERGQHLGKMMFAILSRQDMAQTKDHAEDGVDVSRSHNRHPSNEALLLLDHNSSSHPLIKSDLDLEDISYQIHTLNFAPSTFRTDTTLIPESESDSNYGHSITTMVDEVPTINVVPPSPNQSSQDLT